MEETIPKALEIGPVTPSCPWVPNELIAPTVRVPGVQRSKYQWFSRTTGMRMGCADRREAHLRTAKSPP